MSSSFVSPINPAPSLLARPLKISFEFFPPKNEKMAATLWHTVQRLAPLQPDFVSVTYGAGGSTRERTAHSIARILKETTLNVAAHLTCVDATCEEVNQVAQEFAQMGIRHFVALRGDPRNSNNTASTPIENAIYQPTKGGYYNAAELVTGLKKINPDFEISVSAYPEKHPESPDFATDIDLLKCKIDNGATRAITQAFFDNNFYKNYLEKIHSAGINIPIIPGILPIHNFSQIRNFCHRNKTFIPESLINRFHGLENDPKTHALIAAIIAAEQVLDLIAFGVKEFHFYTLNQAELTYAICHLLGMTIS